MKRLIAILLLLCSASPSLADIVIYGTQAQSLYVRVNVAGDTAFNLTEGTSLKLGQYTATNATIAATSLPAGTYTYRVFVGTAAAQASGDTVISNDVFIWDGTTTSDDTLAHIISLIQDTLTIVPDPNRTWVLRRDAQSGTVSSTKAVPKISGEAIRLYVDYSRMLGVNEELAATSTMTLDMGSSGCTAASSSFEKNGDVVSFIISGGTASASDYTLTISIDSETGAPITATMLLRVL